MIDRVLQKTGVPADFTESVAGYQWFFARLKAEPSQTYEHACIRALLADEDVARPEFIFSTASCEGEALLQRRFRLNLALGHDKNEAAAQVCNAASALDMTALEKTLRRWSSDRRAAGDWTRTGADTQL